MRRIKKITLRYRSWYLWAAWGLVVLVGVLEICFMIAFAGRTTVAYYEGLVIPRIIIEKQNDIIELQYTLIEELVAKNKTTALAYDLKCNEYDMLVDSFEKAYTPFLNTLGASPEIINGRIYITGPNGTRIK